MHHGIKTICLFFTLGMLLGCSKVPLTSGAAKTYAVAFYNTENFYDPDDAPSQQGDDAYTPTGAYQWDKQRYGQKVKQLAKVIGGIGGNNGPAVIGLSEIENRKVLEDLVNAAPLRKAKYNIVYPEAPAPNGLDLAMLYQPKHFKPTAVERIALMDKTLKGTSPPAILQVKGEFRGELITLYVVQWPLLVKGNRAAQQEQRKAATTLRKQIEAQQAADKSSKIIVLGDFGTEPDNATLEKTLQATGRPNPVHQGELFNTHYLLSVSSKGSYAPRTNLQMTDQILISKSFLDDTSGLQYVRGSAGVYDPNYTKYLFGKYKDTPIRTFSGNVYIGGYSDHFPVFIKLKKKK
ncbi:endonuclease/exonuclease/phosphatase family protein [Pontibacter sp. CAU 1760]